LSPQYTGGDEQLTTPSSAEVIDTSTCPHVLMTHAEFGIGLLGR